MRDAPTRDAFTTIDGSLNDMPAPTRPSGEVAREAEHASFGSGYDCMFMPLGILQRTKVYARFSAAVAGFSFFSKRNFLFSLKPEFFIFPKKSSFY